MSNIKLPTIKQIEKLQKQYGVTTTQNSINSGKCWLMEGSQGRFAMEMLESGICMLPKVQRVDYYGTRVPSRDNLKAGTKGTYLNCQLFWQIFMNDDFDAQMDAIITLENCFGIPEVN